jgi:hypothetical protein
MNTFLKHFLHLFCFKKLIIIEKRKGRMFSHFLLIILSVQTLVINASSFMPGGWSSRNLNEPKFRLKAEQMSKFALEQIGQQRASNQKYFLINVKSYKIQVVAGINHQVEFEMKIINCTENCAVEHCNSIIYEVTWENSTKLSKYDCKLGLSSNATTTTIRPSTSSSPSPYKIISNKDQKAQRVFNTLVRSLNNQSSDPNLWRATLQRVYRQQQNVMNDATNYAFVFSHLQTVCLKNTTTDSSNKCAINPNSKVINHCRVFVQVPPSPSNQNETTTATATANAKPFEIIHKGSLTKCFQQKRV